MAHRAESGPVTAVVDRSFIDQLAAVWDSITRLGAGLTTDEWHLPTDCPGWTVQDQLAHMTGTESSLAGQPEPDLADSTERPGHVHNDLGAFNEAWVEHFRDFPPEQLLTQFTTVTDRRLRDLRSMSEEQLEEQTASPVGTVPYHEFMRVRVMDCWVHEQDIRTATGRPGGMDNAAAGAAIDRQLQTLGYVVGKKVQPPEGTVVVIHVDGPLQRIRAVQVSDGRARPVAAPGDLTTETKVGVTAEVRTDTETFGRLAAGRWTAEVAEDSGLVRLAGDVQLGRAVLESLATTP